MVSTVKDLPRQVTTYLLTVLGVEAEPVAWPKARGLPYYLQTAYRFYYVTIANTPCLLMCAMEPETPAVIAKQRDKVCAAFEGLVIYVAPTISSHNRKRLIEQRVPFIVPGTQLFLPMLGLVLSEYFKAGNPSPKSVLSAPAQLLLIHYLLGHYPEPQSAARLAAQFGYSKMTIGRAANELVALNLAELDQLGREKRLLFTEVPSILWPKALPYLQSPVQKRVNVNLAPQGLLASESALAAQTLLAKPLATTIAIAQDEWNQLKLEDVVDDPQGFVLELWRYNPRLLSNGDCVDNFSLYLSLKDQADERIEQVLEHLLSRLWE